MNLLFSGVYQTCAGTRAQESTPTGVSAFYPEQDQEWIFLIETGAGAGVIINHFVFEILMSLCTSRDL